MMILFARKGPSKMRKPGFFWIHIVLWGMLVFEAGPAAIAAQTGQDAARIPLKIEKVLDGRAVVLKGGQKAVLIGVEGLRGNDPRWNLWHLPPCDLEPQKCALFAGRSRARVKSALGSAETLVEYEEAYDSMGHLNAAGELLVYLWIPADRLAPPGRNLAFTMPERTRKTLGGKTFFLLNALLIREGYSFVYAKYASKYGYEFGALQKLAQSDKKGIWAF